MLQEQVNDKAVALSVKSAKITGRLLAKAMQAFLKKVRDGPKAKHGEQTLKSLSRQGASLTNIEITGDNIGGFRKTARKYNVDFSLKQDNSQTPPRWIVFQGEGPDALTAAFNEYRKVQMKVKARLHAPKAPAFQGAIKALRPPLNTGIGVSERYEHTHRQNKAFCTS